MADQTATAIQLCNAHPRASQGTPAAILTQPSLSRKGHLPALTKINPSDDLLLPNSTHAILLERALKQPGPSAQLLTSQKSSSPSATSCCHLLLRVAGIMEYLESKKNMLPTSKQGSNGKEDFMCIKPWVYVQPQLCHSSRQCQQCLFSSVRHPQSPQGQGRCSPAQEQPCRDHFPFHEHFSADAGLCTQLLQEHVSSSKKHNSSQTNQLSLQSVCSQSLVTETINILFVCNS